MKPKAHILVVEDNAIIFRRLRNALLKENYSVADFTQSVAEAIIQINKETPDIVLLDIHLKGVQTGIDLGKILYEKHQIPFIYVTDYDDDETFYKAIETHQSHYFVKTKPKLESKELLRVIQTVLFNNRQKETQPIIKKNIIGYVDYIENTKNLGNQTEHQKTVALENVSYFTTNSKELDIKKTKEKGIDCFIKLKPNYVRFVDWNDNSLFLPLSLKKIFTQLPLYFAQISDQMIINILPDECSGIINGSRIKVRDKVYAISDTYKEELQRRLNTFYLTSKNITDFPKKTK